MRFIAFALFAIGVVSARSVQKACEPGTRIKVDCNDCICAEDSSVGACTFKKCPLHIAKSILNSRVRREATYEAGQVVDTTFEKKKICEPGLRSKMDCNDCICSTDGTSQACTLMFCPAKSVSDLRIRRETTDEIDQVVGTNLEKKKICEPGLRSKVDCNDCICSKDGTFQACTLKLCFLTHLVSSTTAPEKSSKNDVQADKTSSESSQLVSSGSLLRRRRQISHNRPCVAGTTFKIYCNACSCGTDGYSVACTRRQCPEGVYNEDGSLKNL